jgi:CHAT domain-containing protein
VTNLERALKHYRLALKIRTRDAHPIAWAMTQVAMANTYVERIRGDRAENLDRAIELYQQAMEVRTCEARPAEWAETQYDLAVAYRKRIRGDRAENQEEAIKHYRLALEVHTRQAFPEQWATAQTDLGLVYYRRLRGDRAENLEHAIDLFTQALEVRKRDTLPEQWATTQLCLANAYCDRVQGNRAKNLEQAIDHYNFVLEVRTREVFPYEWAMIQNNLGTAYWERLKGRRMQNIKQAIQLFNEALEIHTPDAFPVDARRAARNLGNLLFGEGRWTEAHAAYTTALQAAKALYTAAFMEAGREAEISENATLYAHDAFCLAHLGQLGEALMKLEEGKTRTLAERLGRDTVQLEKARPEDRRAYRKLVNHLKALEAEQRAGGDDRSPAGTGRPYTEIAGDVKQARKELDTLTQRIHGYLPDFLPAPLDFAAIQALVPDEQTVLVELCVTEKGTVVLVVRREAEPQAVWVEGFTRGELQHLLLKRGERGDPTNGWLVTYWQYQQAVETYAHAKRKADQQPTPANLLALETARVAYDQAWAAWHAATDWITAEIGRRLVAPLHTALHGFSITRLVLIPQGSLFLVPLHATLIGTDGLRLLDRYEVSYTPSAAVLQRCQERAAQARGQGLLAVINPQKDPRLVFTFVEGERIASLFSKDQLVLLEEYEGTKKAVLQNVQGRGYLHFSCHGIYNWSDPLKSGLFLTDPDRLTLEDLQRPSLEFEGEGEKERVEVDMTAAHLVTLSACETGITEATTSRADEYVGLPAGFMLAGVPCVVSSLWSVQDLSTALLMERFYVNHLRGDPDANPRIRSPLPPAEALRRAQIWLRDEVTAQEAARRCDEQIKKLRDRRELVPKWLSEAWRKYSWMARKAPDGRPFAHPFYWAAFILSGTTSDPDRKER